MSFLRNRYAQAVTVILLLQAIAFYAVASRPEHVPPVPPLGRFPAVIGAWTMTQDIPIEKEVLDLLKADDTLNRVYVDPAKRALVTLYIAYFKTQRYGQSPHSPKNCLPGSGWEPVEVGISSLAVPGWDAPIAINRYVVEHGEEKSVTFYWYQSHKRVIATEYAAKFWAVADSIRYHRSDTALVRVIAPVRNNDIARATATGLDFIQALFPELDARMPL
jgi:EpsI family protein